MSRVTGEKASPVPIRGDAEVGWTRRQFFIGAAAAVGRQRGLERVRPHVEFDVLGAAVMPAVDSPGRPGMTVDELATFVRALRRSGRVHGADFAIFDPDLDPTGRYARGIVDCLAQAFETAGPTRNAPSASPQRACCAKEHS